MIHGTESSNGSVYFYPPIHMVIKMKGEDAMKSIALKTRNGLLICLMIFGLLLPSVNAEEAPVLISDESRPTVSDVGVEEGSLALHCESAFLMEATTGTVLYTQNARKSMPPASVTKIMTLLLLMEAVEDGRITLNDTVTVSANAASMGGSQVFLKEGEQMRLEELLKCVIIASANDAAVALAEYLHGSVQSFVTRMNERAKQLGMENTSFENVTGLDDTAEHHLTSAEDIAIMSRELIRYPKVLEYSGLWMDTIRDGAFGLTNTNRLVRFYPGCTGLKTGSTSKAGFCVSVTAERNGFSLICVIMGAESGEARNAAAASLLDWGFSNYGLFKAPAEEEAPISVTGGVQNQCKVSHGEVSCVLPKGKLASVEKKVERLPSVAAPIKEGDSVGKVSYWCDGAEIASVELLSCEEVTRINFFEIVKRMLAAFVLA